MTSRIEQLIDELEEYLESCKPKFMSNSEIIVNKDEIDELLRELRMRIPDEIKHYQKIIDKKEAILNDARTKAQTLIDDATMQTSALINENEILQQARSQADQIMKTAAGQAQDILDRATMEANELRTQATRYTEERLTDLQSVVLSALQSSTANYEKLISSLEQHRDVVQSNLQALRPGESPSGG